MKNVWKRMLVSLLAVTLVLTNIQVPVFANQIPAESEQLDDSQPEMGSEQTVENTEEEAAPVSAVNESVAEPRYEPYLTSNGANVTIEENGASISQYTYAKGHYEDLQSLKTAAGVKTVNFTPAKKTFTVDEDGEYTVRLTYTNGSSEHKFIVVTIPADELKEAVRVEIRKLLADADTLKNNTSIDTEGYNVLSEAFWVTQAEMDAFDLAIFYAGDIENDVKATLNDLKSGLNDFTIALEKFKGLRKPGIKAYPEIEKDGVTITVNPRGNSVKQYKYAKGYYTTYEELYANPGGVTTVAYSEARKSFSVSEAGTYTVRIILEDGSAIHRFVDIYDSDIEDLLLDQKKAEAIDKINTYYVSENGDDVPTVEKWITVDEKDTAIANVNNAETFAEIDAILSALDETARYGNVLYATVTVNGNRVTVNANGNDLKLYNYAKGKDLNSYAAMKAAGLTTVTYSESRKTFIVPEPGYYTVRINYNIVNWERFITVYVSPDTFNLESMILQAEELLAGVKISPDGKDIMDLDYWVTQELYDALVQAIKDRQFDQLMEALDNFKNGMKDGLLEGARLSSEGLTISVLRGRNDDSDLDSTSDIKVYNYAKGKHPTYNELKNAGMTSVSYSINKDSFEVDENGVYTVRVLYADSHEEHLYIELNANNTMAQLIKKALKRYTDTEAIETDNNETGENVNVGEQWVKQQDRAALKEAIDEASRLLEEAIEHEINVTTEDIQNLNNALQLFETCIGYGIKGSTYISAKGMTITVHPPIDATIRFYQYAKGHYEDYYDIKAAEDFSQINWRAGNESFTVKETGEYTVRVVYLADPKTNITKEAEFHYIEITKAEIYKKELAALVEEAAELSLTTVSEDGSEVSGDLMWTTSKSMEALEAALVDANAVLQIEELQEEKVYREAVGKMKDAITEFKNSLFSGRLGIPYLTVIGDEIIVVPASHTIKSFDYAVKPGRYTNWDDFQNAGYVTVNNPQEQTSFKVTEAGTYTVRIIYEMNVGVKGQSTSDLKELYTCASISEEELSLVYNRAELLNLIDSAYELMAQTKPTDSSEFLTLGTWYAPVSAFTELYAAIKAAEYVYNNETVSKNVATAILVMNEAYEKFVSVRKCKAEKTPYLVVEGTAVNILTDNQDMPIKSAVYAPGVYYNYNDLKNSNKMKTATNMQTYFTFEPEETGVHTVLVIVYKKTGNYITNENGIQEPEYTTKDYFLQININQVSAETMKKKLSEAIAGAEDLLNGTFISDDPSKVFEGSFWVTQEEYDSFTSAILKAKNILNQVKSREGYVSLISTYAISPLNQVSDEYKEALDALEAAMDAFNASRKEGKRVDKTPLENALAIANAEISKVKVSADGNDVKSTRQWVTQEVMDEMLAAVAKADAVLQRQDITGKDITAAVKELNAALAKFLDALEYGSIEIKPYAELDGKTIHVKLNVGPEIAKIRNLYYTKGVWVSVAELITKKPVIIKYSEAEDGFTSADDAVYSILVELEDGDTYIIYTAVPDDKTIAAKTLLGSVLGEISSQIENIYASADGKDVESDCYWVSHEHMKIVKETIAAASEAYDQESITNEDLIKHIKAIRIQYLETQSQKKLGIPANTVDISVLNGKVTVNGTNLWIYYYVKGEYHNYYDMKAAGFTSVNYRPSTKSFEVDSNGIYTVRIVYKDSIAEFYHINITDFKEPEVTATDPVYSEEYDDQGMQEVLFNSVVSVTMPEGIIAEKIGYFRDTKTGVTPDYTWLAAGENSFEVYGNSTYKVYVKTTGGKEYVLDCNVTGYVYPTMIELGADITVYPNVKTGYSFIAYAKGTYDNYWNAMTDAPGLEFLGGNATVSDLSDGYYTFCVMGKDDKEYFLYSHVRRTPNGTAEGSVTSATTGLGIEGVTLRLIDPITKRYITNFNATTLENGYFKIDKVSAGDYILIASIDGYITDSIPITVKQSDPKKDYLLVMSPELPENQYRFVLTWGEHPKDLDAYLYNLDGGTIYFENKQSENAVLDIDDTSSFGPETITVYNLTGPCDFKVHDYTNRNYPNSKMLSNSGAVVKVYKGRKLLTTIEVPTDEIGAWWNVLSIDAAGELQVHNLIVK